MAAAIGRRAINGSGAGEWPVPVTTGTNEYRLSIQSTHRRAPPTGTSPPTPFSERCLTTVTGGRRCPLYGGHGPGSFEYQQLQQHHRLMPGSPSNAAPGRPGTRRLSRSRPDGQTIGTVQSLVTAPTRVDDRPQHRYRVHPRPYLFAAVRPRRGIAGPLLGTRRPKACSPPSLSHRRPGPRQ